jgi:pyrroline-5-carboxylate reductase
MAEALARGMIRSGLVADPGRVVAFDPRAEARDRLGAGLGVGLARSNAELAGAADVLVLAVKPQSVGAVFAELASCVGPGHLVVSIVAGLRLARLAEGLGGACRLARVMPNTPALVGEGAAGYCLGPNAGEADEGLVRALVDSVGRAYRVEESLLDAVTGLAGSGPAFVFAAIEALSDGGVEGGLPRPVATALAAQTVLGAARMVLETGAHPGALKDQVASPAGTTIAGLHALERGGLRAALMDAVRAATQRSIELGRGS